MTNLVFLSFSHNSSSTCLVDTDVGEKYLGKTGLGSCDDTFAYVGYILANVSQVIEFFEPLCFVLVWTVSSLCGTLRSLFLYVWG